MKSPIVILAILSVFGILAASAPARVNGQSAAAPQAMDHASMMAMMSRMTAANQKVDEAVKKMSATEGAAKVDAIAEAVAAIAEAQQSMHAMCSMMPGMNMPMMNMPGGAAHDYGDTAPPPPSR